MPFVLTLLASMTWTVVSEPFNLNIDKYKDKYVGIIYCNKIEGKFCENITFLK